MPKTPKKPAYCLHKPTGQARVRIKGKDQYLGAFGSPESRERYDDLIREWCLKNGSIDTYTLTVDDLAIHYLDHAENYYRHPDGTSTGTAENIRDALRPLVKVHGRTRVREFGPKALKDVRQAMIESGQCRTYINGLIGKIKGAFRWAVEEELVPVEVYQALLAVKGLSEGRSKARESDPVESVPQEIVTATLEHLPQVPADMVRLQLLTGARPGEICAMRPCDVTRGTDGVWTYRPVSHKTKHRGKERRIYIGPEGQQILAPYLSRDANAYCFSPVASERQRSAERRENRKSPMTPSQAARKPKRKKPLHDCYDKNSYNRVVARACQRAFGMPKDLRKFPADLTAEQRTERRRLAAEWRAKHCWSPNQLRHTRATMLRAQFGIEAAQVVLGHSSPQTTLIYAEAQFGKAAEIARQTG